MTMKTLERLKVTRLIEPQDVGTADVTSGYKDVSLSKKAVILASAGAVTAAKILTVQPMQATSAAGANAKVLGAAVTAAGAGGNAPTEVKIEIDVGNDMDGAGGFKYLAVTLGIDENAKLGSAWLVEDERRFTP